MMQNLELVIFLECFFCRISHIFLINSSNFLRDFQGKLNWQISKCPFRTKSVSWTSLSMANEWFQTILKRTIKNIRDSLNVTLVEIFILRVVYDSLKQCSFLLGQVPLTSPVLQDREFSWLWFYFSQWPHLVIPILLESKVSFLSVHFLFFSSFGFLQWTWV